MVLSERNRTEDLPSPNPRSCAPCPRRHPYLPLEENTRTGSFVFPVVHSIPPANDLFVSRYGTMPECGGVQAWQTMGNPLTHSTCEICDKVCHAELYSPIDAAQECKLGGTTPLHTPPRHCPVYSRTAGVSGLSQNSPNRLAICGGLGLVWYPWLYQTLDILERSAPDLVAVTVSAIVFASHSHCRDVDGRGVFTSTSRQCS